MADSPRTVTVRQQMIEALSREKLSAKDLSRIVGVTEKDVVGHLVHVAKSVTAHGRFVTFPSRCLDCDFTFRKRRRLGTPSRCPICKSESVTETRYTIETS